MKKSALQRARESYQPKLPRSLQGAVRIKYGDKTQSCGDQEEISRLFPHSYGLPVVEMERDTQPKRVEEPFNVGIILSGGQAPGGHNVVSGIFDGIKRLNPECRLYGFLMGPAGFINHQYMELTANYIQQSRNTGGFDIIGSGRTKLETIDQFDQGLKILRELNIKALVIIGGDDSNTNAAVLAEYYKEIGADVQVIGVPKTIDGDLKNQWIETSFGFDTATKVYSEMIGNIQRDCNSSKKYYHFIKLMGRSASHIALECALQTQPNICIISEEVQAKRMTLDNIVSQIAYFIAERAKIGWNFGTVLIPEGLIEFIPSMKKLIEELNDILAEHGDEIAQFEEIEKLANKYPMNARYRLLMGDLHLENEETEKALTCYQQAHEIDPDDPRYIVSMANYYDQTGDKEAAEQEIRDALVNEKLDVETKVGILSRYVQRLQQTQQGIENANSLFQTLLDQHPEDTELKLMYGSLLMAQQKEEEAKFQFQLVTEMEPSNEGAWQQLLNISLKGEDIPEVIRICTRCKELFPEAPEYYFYLGIGYYMQEKYQESLDTYYAGLKIIPEGNGVVKSNFYGQIGDLYYQMEKMDEAYKAYDEALKYNENNAPVLNNYSYFLTLDKKDLKKAERMAAQCIKLEPDNATYLDTYAWVFFVQGNYTLAKIYIENALSKDKTNSAELVDHYGDILYMSGEKDKALEQWKKAKEMGKDTDVLKQKIAKGIYIEDTESK